ncbi:MAG: hypothetical protein EF813_12740 [Methanosarcinales archaeon]|nr:MAG: hypothetical protein EF813_12740 [Methanosarcinales archaeon]
MSRYIPDIRAIRSFVPFVILYADFITNFTNVPNATDFNRLFSGKPVRNDRAKIKMSRHATIPHQNHLAHIHPRI